MKEESSKKLKTTIWGVIGGSIITMIIGFSWGGWVLGSTSLDLGEKMAQAAVTERLTPICVGQFNLDPKKVEKLKILNEKGSWEGDDYIMEQGWSTIPFEKEPDNRIADSCYALLTKNVE